MKTLSVKLIRESEQNFCSGSTEPICRIISRLRINDLSFIMTIFYLNIYYERLDIFLIIYINLQRFFTSTFLDITKISIKLE